MNGSGGSYQSELADFITYYNYLNGRVNQLRQSNPPVFLRRALRFKDWPSFDGDSMAPDWVSVYDYPAEDKINAFLNREYNKVGKDLFGDCHCQSCEKDPKNNHYPWGSEKNPRK